MRVDDRWYFRREYVARRDWRAGDGNNLVRNFKIPPEEEKKNPYRWKHKRAAARTFAEELAELLAEGCQVAFVPTSKTPDHPEFDSRFQLLAQALTEVRPDLRIVDAIQCHKSHDAYHLASGRRSVAEIRQHLTWRGGLVSDSPIAVVDDVVTSGAHFRACEELIHEALPGVRVTGVFWAVTVQPEDDSDDPWDF